MKYSIHPTYYARAALHCACGNILSVGSTKEKIDIEICSACHPFFTGKEKLVDTAGRVDAFNSKLAGAGKKIMSKTEKRKLKKEKKLADEASRPESLDALRAQA